MIQGDSLHTILCNFQQDFKAEIIAAEIAEQGIDPDQILLQMLGLLKRTYSNDVKVVETEILEDHKEYTIVKAAREGIYDMLPQSLFHHPTPHKSARSEKEIIATMKRRREEELNARKFFLPFEATINHLRIEMALHENRLDKRAQYDDLVQLFAGHWEIFQYLNARQANIFLHLIPIVHDIRDNHAKIREIMEMIFDVEVVITLRSNNPSSRMNSCSANWPKPCSVLISPQETFNSLMELMRSYWISVPWNRGCTVNLCQEKRTIRSWNYSVITCYRFMQIL